MASKSYNVVGVLDFWCEYPSFTYPVIERDGELYVQDCSMIGQTVYVDKLQKLAYFERISVRYFSDFSVRKFLNDTFDEEACIVAFLEEENSVVIGTIPEMKNFFETNRTDGKSFAQAVYEFYDSI